METSAARPRRALRAAIAGVVVGALAVLGWAAPARADVAFVEPPERLYMAPAGTSVPDPLIPVGELVFDGMPDLISHDLRKIEIESEDDCAPGPTWDMTGCTAVQLDVGHGELDFTVDPTRIDFDSDDDGTNDDVVYQLPGGSIVRDMDSDDDLPAPLVALLGTTAQLNADLPLLRYTPDDGYYYTGNSDGEILDIDIVPGAGASGSLTHWTEIRVLDVNDFPTVEVPDTLYQADPGQEIVLTPPTEWEVTDEDNDEVIDGEDPPDSGNDPDDGAGDEFVIIAWASCGQFHFQGGSGMSLYDDLEHLLEWAFDLDSELDPAIKAELLTAFLAIIPDEVEELPFATGSPLNYASAFAGVVDDIQWLNYHLDEISFEAVEAGTSTPLPDGVCDIRFLITDIGNNGLPFQYLYTIDDQETPDPSDDFAIGAEIPFFGIDLDTNDAPGVEKVSVQVGEGEEIAVSLSDTTVVEGGTSTIDVTISPATHPAFDLTIVSNPVPPTTEGVDYTAIPSQTLTIPENAATVPVTVDALDDDDVDPDETYTVTATGPPTDPPGTSVTIVDGTGLVTITDTDVPLPANQAPQLTVTSPAMTTVDAPVALTASAADPDAATADVELTLTVAPTGGAVTAGGTFTWGGGTDVASDTLVAPIADIVTALSSLVFTPAAGETGTARLDLEIDDLGNTGTGGPQTDTASIEIQITDDDPGDVTGPGVAIEQGAAQPDPTSVSPIVFDVVFTEPVTGFTDTDVALSGTAIPSTATVTELTASTYTVEVSGMTGDGTVVAEILPGAAQDAAANLSDASTSIDNTVTYEFDPDEPEPDPLAIQVPADIVVDAAPGETTAVVTFPDPTATGGVPPVTIACDHSSGDAYPLGVTTVTCTATDSAEIQLFFVVSDSFTITVNPTDDPGDGDGGGDDGGGDDGGGGDNGGGDNGGGDNGGSSGGGGDNGGSSGGGDGGGALPPTGADPIAQLLSGVLLLLAGAAALLLSRRRDAASRP